MAPPSQGIKIAELARRSGTSKETIHFYLREGLLRKPKKTSRNMAYYDETHIEQLKLIKRLRTESYLPLNVIKKVMKEGKLGTSARQLDLAGELFGQGAKTEFEPLTKKQLSIRTGLTEKRISEYETGGLLRPRTQGKKKGYGYEDVRIAELLKVAEEEAGEGGEPFVLERFEIIERHLEALVREEMSHFFSRIVAEGNPARALEMLRGGRDTIGRYLAIARARRLRDDVESMMPAIEGAIQAAAPENWFEHLAPDVRERVGESAYKRTLIERFVERPDDLEGAIALFEHLVVIGDQKEMLDFHPQARGKVRDHPTVLRALVSALADAERFEEAFSLSERLREERETPDALLEALWGSILLIRLRQNFQNLSSSTELIGYLARAFNAFDLARATPTANRFESARVHLMLGRVSIATPAFLGAREQGRRDLLACLEDIAVLRREKPGKEGELIPAVGPGLLERMEMNVYFFLSRVSADAKEAERLRARADEVRRR
jgi:DNA-binding transcriptional MerR regulator